MTAVHVHHPDLDREVAHARLVAATAIAAVAIGRIEDVGRSGERHGHGVRELLAAPLIERDRECVVGILRRRVGLLLRGERQLGGEILAVVAEEGRIRREIAEPDVDAGHVVRGDARAMAHAEVVARGGDAVGLRQRDDRPADAVRLTVGLGGRVRARERPRWRVREQRHVAVLTDDAPRIAVLVQVRVVARIGVRMEVERAPEPLGVEVLEAREGLVVDRLHLDLGRVDVVDRQTHVVAGAAELAGLEVRADVVRLPGEADLV